MGWFHGFQPSPISTSQQSLLICSWGCSSTYLQLLKRSNMQATSSRHFSLLYPASFALCPDTTYRADASSVVPDSPLPLGWADVCCLLCERASHRNIYCFDWGLCIGWAVLDESLSPAEECDAAINRWMDAVVSLTHIICGTLLSYKWYLPLLLYCTRYV